MDSIVKAAEDYIEGRPSSWGQLAQEQAYSAIDWISRETLIRSDRIRESSISEEIFTLLLQPEAVRHYVSLGSASAIDQAITLRVRAAVASSELRGHLVATELEEFDPERDLDDELVVGKRYRPFIVDSVLEDSASYPASLSSFRPFDEIDVDWHASFQDLQDDENGESTLDTAHTNLKDSSQSAQVFDFIAPELYQALIQNPELIRSVDWRTFEKLLAHILERFDYTIDLQRGTKDGGVDIFALRKDGVFGTEKYLIQAKRWKNAVGVVPVRELAFLHQEYGMTKSCLATTATFTRGAWQLADLHKWKLHLKDFEGIKNWMLDANSRKPEKYVRTASGLFVPK